MMDNRANVAVQMPVFTANTVRRCKSCTVLVNQFHDQVNDVTNSHAYSLCEANDGPLTEE